MLYWITGAHLSIQKSAILYVLPVLFSASTAKNISYDVLIVKNDVPKDRRGGGAGGIRWLPDYIESAKEKIRFRSEFVI